MREYGQVQSAFWQSTDAQAFSDRGKLLALYLLCGPHTNGIGCFRVGDGAIMDDLGWDQVDVQAAFAELCGNGFAKRENSVVFVPNFLRWNKIINKNIAKARFGDFLAVPKGTLKCLAASAMLEFSDHWSKEDRNALETIHETLGETQLLYRQNQNPTPPHPTLPQRTQDLSSEMLNAENFELLPIDPPVPAPLPRFDDFWDAYPVKKGKAAAEAKWKARNLDRIADQIIADVRKRLTNDREWVDGYIPHGSTYVNGKVWEDAIKPLNSIARNPPAASKTLTAIQSLEDLKNGTVDRTRDCGRISEADDLEPRQAAGGRLDQRYRDDMG